MIQCVHGFLSSALFKKVGGTPCRLFSTNVFFLLYKSHTVLLAYYYYYTKKLLIFSALYERLLPFSYSNQINMDLYAMLQYC